MTPHSAFVHPCATTARVGPGTRSVAPDPPSVCAPRSGADGCGRFESSRQLREGLQVMEIAPDDWLALARHFQSPRPLPRRH